MSTSAGRSRVTIAIAAALLGACSTPASPMSAPGLPAPPAQTKPIAIRVDAGGSWMSPEASGKDLLYVSTEGPDVFVLSYPAGHLVGVLHGFNGAAGECVDSSGDVWIADEVASELVEYAHGGATRKVTLGDSAYYFAVLRLGSKKLETIALDEDLYVSGAVQWDGKHIVLGGWNGSNPVLDQTTGFEGHVVKSIDLNDGGPLTFSIQRNIVISGDCCKRGLSLWKYPQGGTPVGYIAGKFSPYYTAVSSP